MVHLCHISSTTVYSNKKLRPLLGGHIDVLTIQTKALIMPVRDIESNILILCSLEEIRNDHRTRDTVCVIVREDKNMLSLLYCLKNPVSCFFHIGQKEWRM